MQVKGKGDRQGVQSFSAETISGGGGCESFGPSELCPLPASRTGVMSLAGGRSVWGREVLLYRLSRVWLTSHVLLLFVLILALSLPCLLSGSEEFVSRLERVKVIIIQNHRANLGSNQV